VAGYYNGLKTGLNQIGIKANLVTVRQNAFLYSNDTNKKWFLYKWRQTTKTREATPKKHIIKKIISVLHNNIYRYILLLWVVKNYNVLLFSYGETITNSKIELLIYKLSRKTLVFIFHGSDSRPPYMAAKYANPYLDIDYNELKKITIKQKKKLTKIEKYADYIVNGVVQAQFLENKFIDHKYLGLPIDITPTLKFTCCKTRNEKTRILHSPSDSNIKGTITIQRYIMELKEQGHNIDFRLVHNVSNNVVIEEIKQCDFIVDCLYSDSPMGHFGAEGACYGKPAVLGGYFSQQIHNYYNDDEIAPAHYVVPEDLKKGIEDLIVNPELRTEIGISAFNFVSRKYSPNKVAQNYLRIFSGNEEKHWYIDPNRIMYYNGSIPQNRLKIVVSELINLFGDSVLQLNDKPKLLRSLVDFVSSD